MDEGRTISLSDGPASRATAFLKSGGGALFWAFVAMIPNLIWVLVDRSPFDGDSAVHATDALGLFDSLRQAPQEWLGRMLTAIAARGPGLAWVGQIFVPLGEALGSKDLGFHLLVVALNFTTFALLYLAVLRFSGGRISLAILSCLAAGSAPLQIYLSHLFFIEPLQVTAVSWFILILASAPLWNPAFTISQLFIAASFAFVSRASTPLYCVVPGAAALWIVFSRSTPRRPWCWRTKGAVISLTAGVLLALSGAGWMFRNFRILVSHSRSAAVGPVAARWGKVDTFFNTFLYWIQALWASMIPKILLQIVGLLVLLAVSVWTFARYRGRLRATHFEISAAAAAAQIIFCLALLSLSANRTTRYLLPMLPCVVLLVTWSAGLLQRRAFTSVALAVFSVIFVLAHLSALGLVSFIPTYRPASADTVPIQTLDEIVSRTCLRSTDSPYPNIIAVDPNLKGDWLSPALANYTAAKRYGLSAPCLYTYVGNSFFGAGLEDAWADIENRRPKFVVITDPKDYPPPHDAMNETLKGQNYYLFFERLAKTGVFRFDGRLESDRGIVVFRSGMGAAGASSLRRN